VTQRLVVIRDRVVVEAGNAECPRDLQPGVALRQLPQPAKQPARRASRQHQLATALDPQRHAREDGQLAFLLASRDDGQLVLPARLRRHA
jgi:hypothetical protein